MPISRMKAIATFFDPPKVTVNEVKEFKDSMSPEEFDAIARECARQLGETIADPAAK